MEKKLGIYRHYKGNTYEVIGFGKHSETLEDFVVYKALYDSPDFGTDAIWIRPQKMFFENVEFGGETIARFSFIK